MEGVNILPSTLGTYFSGTTLSRNSATSLPFLDNCPVKETWVLMKGTSSVCEKCETENGCIEGETGYYGN